jgi:hypothetical protein
MPSDSQSDEARDDSADKIAELTRLSDLGNKRETIDSVEPEKAELSYCFSGLRGLQCGVTPNILRYRLFPQRYR